MRSISGPNIRTYFLNTLYKTLSAKQKRRKKKTRVWVRGWIKRHEQLGAFNLITELWDQDEWHFKNLLRIEKVDFDYILEKVSPRIRRHLDETSHYIKGTPYYNFKIFDYSYRSLKYLFGVPANTISLIVPQVCQAIYDVLKDEYLKVNQQIFNITVFMTKTKAVRLMKLF
ncbi:hypothetical protein RI129_002787 [Pyrocoelia pectoralis]|uniref:Uncharacterized protein n=1 Tax=Pyrocoelia pectoralis TaxID=417401 RepID=A0AAN7VGN4_9COLE